MELKINIKDLLNGLRQVAPAIKQSPIIPITESVLVECNGDFIKLTGTNSGVTIEYTIPAECPTFNFALPFFKACKILELLTGECIISVTETRIEIKSGEDVFKLGAPADAKYFPKTPEKGMGFSVDVTGDFFHNLKNASSLVYKGITTGVDLCNVFIDFSEGDTIIFASDTRTAFLKTIPVKASKKQIKILPELLKAIYRFQDAELFIDDNRLFVEYNRTTVIIQLSEAKDVSVRAYKSFKKEANFTCDPEYFISTLDKSLVYEDEDFAAGIELSFNKDKLTIYYEDSALNEGVVLSCTVKGSDEKSILLNGKQLKAITNVFGAETKQLEICVTSPDKNMIISSEEEQIITFIQPLKKLQ